MMLVEIYRWRYGQIEISLKLQRLRRPTQLIIFNPKITDLFTQLIVIVAKPLHFLELSKSTLPAPIQIRERDRYKKAGYKKSDCESKNERYDPLEQPGVLHITSPLNTNDYDIRRLSGFGFTLPQFV
jgi:hypothetical protein